MNTIHSLIHRKRFLTLREEIIIFCAVHKIEIHHAHLKSFPTMSYCLDGQYGIIVDAHDIADSVIVCYLLHEVGHIVTNSLYVPYSTNRISHEYTASNWAVQVAIGKHKLHHYIAQDKTLGDISNQFGVHERMIRYAMWYCFKTPNVWDGKLATANEVNFV